MYSACSYIIVVQFQPRLMFVSKHKKLHLLRLLALLDYDLRGLPVLV